MFDPVPHPHLLDFDHPVDLGGLPTAPHPKRARRRKKRRAAASERIAQSQRVLHASQAHAVLIILQGMDASGKDGAIRHVFRGVNPAGVHVTSFGKPSTLERSHDFLWRTTRVLPPKGMIGVFNRSYYEDVVVVRADPEVRAWAGLPAEPSPTLWQSRFRAIRAHERHLADTGTRIVKVFLHVGRAAQRTRLLRRLHDPARHWKFDASDLRARSLWPAYTRAWEQALLATHRPWAPWYVVPADDKKYARATLAELFADTLEGLDLAYPTVEGEALEALERFRQQMAAEETPDAEG